MQDTWVLGPLSWIFGLLSSLQGVSNNETANTCDILNCPKIFRCCDNECCLDQNVWTPANNPLRILFIVLLVLLLLLYFCGLVWYFCSKNRELQHEVRRVDHQTPPEPPSIAPLEIFNSSLDPEPPYFEVVLKPTPTEPPPPYSLHAVQMRGTGFTTL
ncbi:transmembrane protein 92-like [Grammomys surdaster]|uniref:transmembrane protein 92-like n=1 Tax=Grammomys surdaster TaxID=491861 RepID=UPI0010A091F5|nr:transmembrane protein 92-like [Grammomys surdaster]